MRPRFSDLAAVLDARGGLLADTGQAVIAHGSLPHPVLRLMECLYPREVGRARFRALWSERDAEMPDPLGVGMEFKQELAAIFQLQSRFAEQYTLVTGSCRRER